MSNYILKKAATTAGQGYLRDYEAKRNGYVISAPDRDDRGKKMKDRAKLEWEMARYERAGIPAHDLKILMKVKHNAKALDAGHRIGPLKYGKASIVGLLPLVGDFADVLLAYWDVYLPARKISKGEDVTAFKTGMKVRIVCLGCVGTIPFVGDLADTIIKWNMRNAAALEKLLLTRAGYFETIKAEKAMSKKGSRRHRAAEFTPVRGSEENQIEPPPRYDSEYRGRHVNTAPAYGEADNHISHDRRARGAVTNGGTGSKIGAAVGGWLGGLHGRLTNNNGQQHVTEDHETAPVRPPRPTNAAHSRHEF